MRFLSKAAFAVLLLCGFVWAQPKYSDCTPSFKLVAPWQGADAAYSIPLADGRDVWIFGDTLYGAKRAVAGKEPEMVHNTIGISTCKNGKFDIQYSIKHNANGAFDSFFKPQKNDGTYYWALDGVAYKDELWITLLCVRNKAGSDAFALGFEVCGTDLAKVTGIKGDPQTWDISYFPLVPEQLHANPSASALVQGDYVYIYTLSEQGSRPQILTRILLKGLNDPKKNLQYLGNDDQWRDGLEPAKAKVVMNKGASEMSVRYHPELGKWVAVLVDPQLFSDKVFLRTAPSMTGPFTDGDVIYKIPILQKSDPKYDPDTFCYAGKEHPEFEKSGELVFTYVCNTMKPKKLEAEPYIYFPQVVHMPMPDGAKK